MAQAGWFVPIGSEDELQKHPKSTFGFQGPWQDVEWSDDEQKARIRGS
jgi:hypothetical protein